MSTIKRCDRHKRPIKEGEPVYAVKVIITRRDDDAEEEVLFLEDCCERCRTVIKNCITMKRSRTKRAKKKKTAPKPPRKPVKKATVKKATDTTHVPNGGQFSLPTPGGAPPKPSVPPPPEVD